MKRRNPRKVDDAAWYENIWNWERIKAGEHRFDAVRMRAFLPPDLVRLNYLVPPNQVKIRLLDLGAGLFGLAHWLIAQQEVNPHLFELTSLDQSPAAAEIYGQLTGFYQGCHRYLIGKVEATGLAAESFDLVTAGELIEHMEEPQDLVREMARLCRPGGWMVISTVDHECPQSQVLDYPEHVWALDGADLLALFNPYGLATYRLVGNYHFCYCQKG